MPKIGEPDFKNPLENPEAAKAEIEAILADANSGPEKPVIEYPPSDLVELPGGYVNGNGDLVRHAKVRELTGDDEEAMARAVSSNNPIHFVNTILERGVVQVGDEPVERTKEILREMLVGDKEHLFLNVRIATYGNEVRIANWIHVPCGYQTDLTIHLDGPEQDIEVRKMESPQTDMEFDVPLWKGGKVRVRLAKGSDQSAAWEDPKRNKVQMESVILSRCIARVYNSDGTEIAGAFVPGYSQKLGLRDRKKILRELMDRQPGPKLDDIKFDCQGCGEKVSLAIGLEELFLNFELLPGV